MRDMRKAVTSIWILWLLSIFCEVLVLPAFAISTLSVPRSFNHDCQNQPRLAYEISHQCLTGYNAIWSGVTTGTLGSLVGKAKATPSYDPTLVSLIQSLGARASPFASDYREFVRRYGGAVVGPYPIFGLRRAEPMGTNEGSVVEITRRFHQKRWPGTEAWVVFSLDHAGNPIGMDKDGKVWISDHDAGAVQLLAPTFEEYLRRRCLKLPD